MKTITSITNLSTNEISTIGAGFSLPQSNTIVKLAQSTIEGIKRSTPMVIDKTKVILSALSPVISLVAIASIPVTQVAYRISYQRRYDKLNEHVSYILSRQ